MFWDGKQASCVLVAYALRVCMLASCVLQMLATAEAKVKYVVVLQVTGTGRGLELDVALQCCTEFFNAHLICK